MANNKKTFTKQQADLAAYYKRTDKREETLMQATMSMIAYFVGLGDDQATAEDKVGQISDECAHRTYQYTLGRTQPLLDCINASALPFMDQAAKDALTGYLAPPV